MRISDWSSDVCSSDLAAELPGLIRQVYGTLAGIDGTAAASIAGPAEKLQPAVPIKKSVTPEFIICLEDGKKLKMLKRHLMSHYNMTPEQYRELRSEDNTSELQLQMRNSHDVSRMNKTINIRNLTLSNKLPNNK